MDGRREGVVWLCLVACAEMVTKCREKLKAEAGSRDNRLRAVRKQLVT